MDLNRDNFSTGLGIATVAAGVVFFRKIKLMLIGIFGGQIDKMEFGGLCCLVLLVYMVIKEANRGEEWHLFSDLYILFIAGGAMTGLGLNSVLDHIRRVKETDSSVQREETTNIEITKTQTPTEDERP